MNHVAGLCEENRQPLVTQPTLSLVDYKGRMVVCTLVYNNDNTGGTEIRLSSGHIDLCVEDIGGCAEHQKNHKYVALFIKNLLKKEFMMDFAE